MASRPSFSGDPQSRRLGVGGGPGGGERLLRAQLVIALVFGFTILAVILYLWRRPSGTEHAAVEPATPSASASAALPPIVRTKVEAPLRKVEAKVKVAPVQHLKCGASPKLSGGEGSLCDALPFFEQTLEKAILDTAGDCVQKQKEEGTINHVLVVDFRNHSLRVYPGQSGSWRGKQARRATECVKRVLGTPAWASITHQYRYYMLSMLATYPAAQPTSDGLPSFQ